MKSRVFWWLGVACTALLVLWLLSMAYGLWEIHALTGAPWDVQMLTGSTEVVDARHHSTTIIQLTGVYGPFGTPWWLFPTSLLLVASVCFHLRYRFRSVPSRVD